MKGFGTVVTGTLVSGSVAVEGELEILPERRPTRVRGLQVHGQAETSVEAGHRVAVNVGGVEVADVIRGYTLAEPNAFEPTRRIDVRLDLLDGVRRPCGRSQPDVDPPCRLERIRLGQRVPANDVRHLDTADVDCDTMAASTDVSACPWTCKPRTRVGRRSGENTPARPRPRPSLIPKRPLRCSESFHRERALDRQTRGSPQSWTAADALPSRRAALVSRPVPSPDLAETLDTGAPSETRPAAKSRASLPVRACRFGNI